MPITEETIAELREKLSSFPENGWPIISPDETKTILALLDRIQSAEARYTALEAERDALIRERDDLAKRCNEWSTAHGKLKRKNDDTERERDEARAALGDLISWFPAKPVEPVWQLRAGDYGADDAISSARAVLARTGEPT